MLRFVVFVCAGVLRTLVIVVLGIVLLSATLDGVEALETEYLPKLHDKLSIARDFQFSDIVEYLPSLAPSKS